VALHFRRHTVANFPALVEISLGDFASFQMNWKTTEDNGLIIHACGGYCIQQERNRLGNEQIRLFKGRNEYVRKDGEPIGSLAKPKPWLKSGSRLALSAF
jgi:hypothetical protein